MKSMSGLRALACAALLAGCRPATVKMQGGVPLEVQRGYCFAETQFKQHGKPLNWDQTIQRLSRHPRGAALVREGNTLALASILATVVAGSGIIIGTLAKEEHISMSDGASNAMLAVGTGAMVASWVLCITSDGKYVAAAHAYNAGLSPRRAEDEDAELQVETWE